MAHNGNVIMSSRSPLLDFALSYMNAKTATNQHKKGVAYTNEKRFQAHPLWHVKGAQCPQVVRTSNCRLVICMTRNVHLIHSRTQAGHKRDKFQKHRCYDHWFNHQTYWSEIRLNASIFSSYWPLSRAVRKVQGTLCSWSPKMTCGSIHCCISIDAIATLYCINSQKLQISLDRSTALSQNYCCVSSTHYKQQFTH